MRAELKEHLSTKRKIRQAKRLAAVDQNRPKRMRLIVILIICAVILLASECFGLYYTKLEHDRQHADETASNMVSDLAIMSVALQSGNQALFEQNFNEFQKDLTEYSQNHYVQQNSKDNLSRLQNYATILRDDAATISEMNQLHSMLNQLSLIAESDNLVENLAAYRQNLVKLEENLVEVDAEQLQDARKMLEGSTNELEAQLESIAICVNVCPSSTIKDKKELFTETISDAVAKFETLNETLVERYSPHQYILLLQ